MIETTEETTCKACGKPLVQVPGRGHRQRLYCDDTCRQRAHRAKEPVTIGTNDAMLQARITELEQELAAAHTLIDKYINRKRTPPDWKRTLQERWLQLGKAADWPALTIPVHVQAGERSYRIFALAASNELIEEGNIALRKRDIWHESPSQPRNLKGDSLASS